MADVMTPEDLAHLERYADQYDVYSTRDRKAFESFSEDTAYRLAYSREAMPSMPMNIVSVHRMPGVGRMKAGGTAPWLDDLPRPRSRIWVLQSMVDRAMEADKIGEAKREVMGAESDPINDEMYAASLLLAAMTLLACCAEPAPQEKSETTIVLALEGGMTMNQVCGMCHGFYKGEGCTLYTQEMPVH